MNVSQMKPGIKQRLQRAASADELKALCAELRGYESASQKTLNKCQKIINRKLKEFGV